MNQGLFWKLVVAAPFLLAAPGVVWGEDSAPPGLPKVFEELPPLEYTSVANYQDANAAPSCVAPPACCVETPQGCGNGYGSCYADGSMCCEDQCGPACCIFIAGTEATFLAPQSHGAKMRAVGTDLTLPAVFEESEILDLDGMTYAPRVWIGVQGQEWGLVTRFWYLSDSDEQFHPFAQPGNGGTGAYTDDRTKAYTIDWEATHACCWNDSKFDFTVGGRYAALEAGGSVGLSGLANGGLDIFYSTAIADVEFEGTGFTTSIGGRTPLFDCCGCVYLLWGVRGSYLWGDVTNAVQTSATVIGAASNATSIDSAEATDHGTLYTVEAQLGAQWEYELQCVPASAFFRLVAEYQYWNISAADASTNSTAVIATSTALARAESGDFSMSLLGLSVGTGLTW